MGSRNSEAILFITATADVGIGSAGPEEERPGTWFYPLEYRIGGAFFHSLAEQVVVPLPGIPSPPSLLRLFNISAIVTI